MKMADFDPPQGAETPEPILMKLDIVDYVQDPTPHGNFGGGSATWVIWANMSLVTSLSFFFFFLFFFLLSSARAQVAFLQCESKKVAPETFYINC